MSAASFSQSKVTKSIPNGNTNAIVSGTDRLVRPPYEVVFPNKSLGIALRGATKGGDLPIVTKSSAALPLKGDVIISINGDSIEGLQDPFAEVMERVKTLPRPITLGFKPHPDPARAFESSVPGVLSSRNSPMINSVKSAAARSTSPNKFDPANEPMDSTAAPVSPLPTLDDATTLVKPAPKKASAWSKLRGAVSATKGHPTPPHPLPRPCLPLPRRQ